MLDLFIIVAILLALCFLAIGIRIWIKGRFADTEVGHNPHMRKLGLQCAKEEEIRLWRKNASNGKAFPGCSSCSCCGSSKCPDEVR